MKLHTKSDFTALMHRFLDPLLPLYSEGGARLHLGDTGVTYPGRTIEMEAFSRPLWALAPFWTGGGRADDFLRIYRKGLASGTDPENPEYWGDPNDYDQLFVEMAALACAILETPESVWEPLTDAEKANLAKWLDTINHHDLPGCNWLLFRVLVNLALGWVVLLRHGHLIRNVLAILALWTYAVMAGLSPSVVRSALMLSAAQAALGASVSGNGYNVVFGTATLMLAVQPSYLSDVSFQLSFAAVLSILFFYPRLYRRRLSRHRALDALYSSLLLGAAAQIGTLPLIAYHFGNVPLVSLAINPVVIFAAFVVIGASLLWLLCPLPLWNPFLSRIVETALTVQNGTVAHAAASPAAAIEGIVLPEWAVVLAYALLGMLAVAVKLREEKRTDGPTRRIRKRKVAH